MSPWPRVSSSVYSLDINVNNHIDSKKHEKKSEMLIAVFRPGELVGRINEPIENRICRSRMVQSNLRGWRQSSRRSQSFEIDQHTFDGKRRAFHKCNVGLSLSKLTGIPAAQGGVIFPTRHEILFSINHSIRDCRDDDGQQPSSRTDGHA